MVENEDKLEKILISYNVYQYNSKTRRNSEGIAALNELLDSYAEEEVYIIAPGTQESRTFWQILSATNKKKVKRINGGSELSDSIKDRLFIRRKAGNSVRCIIDVFNNKWYWAFLKKSFLSIINRCRVINICSFLHSRGYVLEGAWFQEFRPVIYSDVCVDCEIYLKARGGDEEKTSIQRLIGDYFAIRDFKNAKKWIDALAELCGEEDPETLKYKKLWKEVECFLSELKSNIQGKKHMVLNWVDTLRFDELHSMRHLENRMRLGVFFEKMYTPTPFTNPTLRTMFMGKYLLDDKTYETQYDDLTKEKLMQYLDQYGYKLISCSTVFRGKVFHNEDSWLCDSFFPIRSHVPSTMIQFEAVCRLAEEEKCFMIIHNICETHGPWLNPIDGKEIIEGIDFTDEKDVEKKMKQVLRSHQYLDEQLEYYGEFYKDTDYNIYMSDHGFLRGEQPLCVEGLHHVVFSVCGKNVKRRSISSLNSLIAFSELMKKCMMNRTDELECVYEKDYVLIQREDVYSPSIISWIEEYHAEIYRHLQCRGVITMEDAYLQFACGERFYLRNDMEGNLIEASQYQNRIAYLKDLAGDNFIDIRQGDRYKASVAWYEKLGLKTRSQQ